MIGLVSENYFAEFVARTNPTPTMVSDIQRLHQTIRDLFDKNQYDTFLQGSYRNDTATKEINDVDIIILRKHTVSAVFSTEHYETKIQWNQIRENIFATLNSHRDYRNRITPDSKCFRIATQYRVDVVPAVRIAAKWEEDPIAIYKTSVGEIKTSPRLHSDNCERKNQATNENFKPLVRMFKWWSRRWVEPQVAPSFYVESLLYNFHPRCFTGNYGYDFMIISKGILDSLQPNAAAANHAIVTPGEGKPLFSAVDWSIDRYSVFYQRLLGSYQLMNRAAFATSLDDAVGLWKQIFGEEFPSRT